MTKALIGRALPASHALNLAMNPTVNPTVNPAVNPAVNYDSIKQT